MSLTESKQLEVCRKPKIGLDSVFKTSNHPKIWHLFRQFSDGNSVQSRIQIKSDKNNFTCIQCADKEHVKKLPKHSLAIIIDDTKCNCYSLLTTVSKSGMRSSFNIAVML